MRNPVRGLLALALAVTLALGGCGRPDDGPAGEDGGQPVNLIYYTIGEPDADLARVNEALNAILLERYGITVEYHKIGWNDYTAQLNSLVGTGQAFDVAFAWTDLYTSGAMAGSWLDLTDYLAGPCKTLYDTVNREFWKGIAVSGRIWGIPTNKELATPVHFLFDQSIVEKYDMDIDACDSLEALEPLLEEVAQREPDYIPLFLGSKPINPLTLSGYQYVSFDAVPLMVRSDDPDCRVVNIFETPEAASCLDTLHRYYEAGYINQDAIMRTSFSRFQDEPVFLRLSTGGPDASASYSTDYGYPIVARQVSDSVVTTESAQGGVMVVSANTEHPEACMTFLTAVNTDPEVRNLLNYGIEGVHYTLTEDDQVKIISPDYRGVPYTQGNWFILKTTVGESVNKWDLYRQFNENTVASPLLGFTPDYSRCQGTFNAVARVYEKYYAALMTGTVDPAEYLPRLQEELQEAGIDGLRLTLQAQIDAWLERAS